MQHSICGKQPVFIKMGTRNRTPQNWFEGLRHRLRHGFVKPLIRELHRLSLYNSTSNPARPVLRQVRDYLKGYLNHIQYRTFKKLGLPIGSVYGGECL